MKSSFIWSLRNRSARWLVGYVLGTLTLMASQQAVGELSYKQAWIKQFGSAGYDRASSVAVDSKGSIFVVGETNGDLGGPPIGSDDIFLVNLAPDGTPLWQTKFGSLTQDYSCGLAIDSSDNVLIGGVTYPLFPANYNDYTFLTKYNSTGNCQWTESFQTAFPDKEGVTVRFDAAGAAYVSGVAENELPGTGATDGGRFIAKYDADGGLPWTRQYGSEVGGYRSSFGSMAVDGQGNTYLCGSDESDRLHPQALVVKLGADGQVLWQSRVTSGNSESASQVAVDGDGNVYIAGATDGDLWQRPDWRDNDVFVAKFDSDGDMQWVRQVLSRGGSNEAARDLVVDDSGQVYVCGSTSHCVTGGEDQYWENVFWATYDTDGNLAAVMQLGTEERDYPAGIAVGPDGSVVLYGYTFGSLAGESAGWSDVFLAKYTVPEPLTLAMLMAGGLMLMRRR